MSFTELLKTIADLYSEVNKAQSNDQQKKFLATLRRIERQIKKQGKIAKRNFVLGVIISSIASAVLGFLLGNFVQ